MQKIAPFLWFDDQAEEAANFYNRPHLTLNPRIQ
jgi:predicted 3-demethylubiquinone-9 3-methyltransferase (glyoxalase superfamily)